MKKGIVSVLGVVLALGILFAEGCQTKAQTGAATGALLGAGTGALIGKGKGAAIGGAAGAIGGYMIGNEMDKSDMREEASTTVVNVPNSNGSYTPVTLRRSGGQWVGPRGETYLSLPSPEQLRSAYGF